MLYEVITTNSKISRHQEAIDIYSQLKYKFSNVRDGSDSLDRKIEHEKEQLILFNKLNESYSIPVKPGILRHPSRESYSQNSLW